ncbi:glycosyltransferase family 2 protein [Aeromonas salmonicida]|uniref:Glycosyltransferase family 2 protein n=1 Tax=Aeromonas salmonicida TaxID=645 RepID=A0AAX3VSK1_AERSA|nr:glycosyltransferase family 2 protein [Aeromonas salmonicida]WHF36671.1 glycosyltransferase family 2 protein [Aeromonas salmonicida]
MYQSCLSISVVTYCTEKVMIASTFNKLQKAVTEAGVVSFLIVVDHSPSNDLVIQNEDIRKNFSGEHDLILAQSNPGFGAGHNRALLTDAKYHLILNPDLEVAPDALKNAIEFMEQHPDCGLLTPFATWEDGQVQRLCKRYPTVFDLLLRGFAPAFVKKLFQARLAKYEMADQLNNHDVLWDPPIVSGCFMLFRTAVLQQLGGFDPRFFLYFEDFDISLRAGKISRIAYVPQVKVVHHGGHASRKGWRHICMFGRSMLTFFNIHGWRWW